MIPEVENQESTGGAQDSINNPCKDKIRTTVTHYHTSKVVPTTLMAESSDGFKLAIIGNLMENGCHTEREEYTVNPYPMYLWHMIYVR